MRTLGLGALRHHLERDYLERLGYGSGRQFMDQLLASNGPGDVLLDAGCGDGKLRHAPSQGVRYVGLDR